MEMESMEEGYLAKILVAEGTEGVPVGKARPECSALPPGAPPRRVREPRRGPSSGRPAARPAAVPSSPDDFPQPHASASPSP